MKTQPKKPQPKYVLRCQFNDGYFGFLGFTEGSLMKRWDADLYSSANHKAVERITTFEQLQRVPMLVRVAQELYPETQITLYLIEDGETV